MAAKKKLKSISQKLEMNKNVANSINDCKVKWKNARVTAQSVKAQNDRKVRVLVETCIPCSFAQSIFTCIYIYMYINLSILYKPIPYLPCRVASMITVASMIALVLAAKYSQIYAFQSKTLQLAY